MSGRDVEFHVEGRGCVYATVWLLAVGFAATVFVVASLLVWAVGLVAP